MILTLIAAGTSFAVTALVVPLVRRLAQSGGFYEQPVLNRWHRRPVPKLGGVAIAAVFLPIAWYVADSLSLRVLIAASALLFGVGLFDDVRAIGATTKFLCQAACACLFLWLAPAVRVTGLAPLDLFLSFVWFVGITNAFNLLDNIDGLSAGIAGIAGTFLVVTLLVDGASSLVPLALIVSALSGAAFGFLVYNWHPASIFMGDSGSHLLGAGLAGATLLAASGMHGSAQPGAAMAIVLLLVPCADTLLVTLTRQLAGGSAFVGGRDHLSHRIVALGMPETNAVLVLYAMAVIGGGVAMGLQILSATLSWILVAAYAVLVAAVGVYLGQVQTAAGATPSPLPGELTARYRTYELLFDGTLIAVAYYLGLVTRFHDPQDLRLFLTYLTPILPLVVGLHLSGLWLAGKYRTAGPDRGRSELATIVKGVVIGSASTVIVVLYLTGFRGYSRQAFGMAGLFVLLLLAGGHGALNALDDFLRRRRRVGPKAIVYGAGRRGTLTVRELASNPTLGLVPFGFIDDDPARGHDRPEGLRVLGTLEQLDPLLARGAGLVTTVIVSIESLPSERFERLCAICDRHDVDVRQLRLSLDDVDTDQHRRRPVVVRFGRD